MSITFAFVAFPPTFTTSVTGLYLNSNYGFGYQGGHFSGIYRKVQLKPLKWVKVVKSNGEGEEERPTEALMVLKYGGVLTHAGRKQVRI